MYTTRGIAVCYGFDYASDLAAEFSWNTRGVHLHRLHILEILRSGKCRRAVIENRESVDYILRIVFGAPRV